MFFVVKVNQFQGRADRPATSDKNGFAPVILTAYNGIVPEKARVISGTVAHRAGLTVGKNYAVKITLARMDSQYGEQYQYDVVGELTTVETVTKLHEFGQGVVQRAVSNDTTNTVNAATPVIAGDKDDF